MGGSDSTTINPQDATSTTLPWGPQGDVLQKLWSQGFDRSQVAKRFFPGSTVGPQSQASGESWQRAAELAQGGNPYNASTAGYLDQTMQGGFLNQESNPWLQGMYDTGARDITRNYQLGVAPTLSLAGNNRQASGRERNAFGNAQSDFGDVLGRYTSNFWGDFYNPERDRMNQAAQMMPQVTGAQRQDLGMASAIGQTADAYSQRTTDDSVNRYNYRRDIKDDQLSQLRGIIDPLGGGVSSATTTGGGSVTTTKTDNTASYVGIGTSLLGLMLLSSRDVKDHITSIRPVELSHVMMEIPVAVWRYNDASPHADRAPHVGPYAEDWYRTFGTGDGKTIPFVDYLGTLMGALQGSILRIQSLEQQVAGIRGDRGVVPGPVLPLPEAA